SGKTKTVTRRKYNKILQTLLQGDERQPINAKFKFWVKSKGFQVGTAQDNKTGSGDRPVLYVPIKATVSADFLCSVVSGVDSSLKRVAVVEDFFDIIYAMHVEISGDPGKAPKHAGQKKTYKAIAETYAFLPREAVTRFLMSCGECQKRMHISTAGQDIKENDRPSSVLLEVIDYNMPLTSAYMKQMKLHRTSSNKDDSSLSSEEEAEMSEPAWLAADLGAASDLSPASRGERMRHSPQNNHGKEEDGKDRCWMSIVFLWLRFPAGSFDRLANVHCLCVQSPQYSSGGSYDSVKMDLGAEDLSAGRHGSQVAPDDDDDEHDDHDDNDKINDTEGVDPERLKAFNMFVRLFVDENLDRMVPISKQPKEKIQAIIESCSRQFPEFQERARKRIRTYLKSCRRMKKNGMETRPTPPHLTSAMAENILAAACENESRNAAKRMRLEGYHVSLLCLWALREPASLTHSAYSLAASAFSSQEAPLYINGAGLSYAYRGYPGLGAAMQHPVSLTTGATAQSNGPTDLMGGASTQLSQPEITAVRQLIAGYRESAAFLLRSADELENLILQQN
uniref:Nucleolar protein 4 helical domain-containing protein n=1 Tax=Mola mola TaxID=94237 RepID=A0A3Q3WN71_MOLML